MLKWLRANTLGTYLLTRCNGDLVGEDRFGNRYYRMKNARRLAHRATLGGVCGRRGRGRQPGAAGLAWLAQPHAASGRRARIRSRSSGGKRSTSRNLSGSLAAYVPPGHERRGGRRDRLRETTRHGVRDRRAIARQLQPIALEIQQRRQHLRRLRAGDHMIVAQYADRHTGDAQGEGTLVRGEHLRRRRFFARVCDVLGPRGPNSAAIRASTACSPILSPVTKKARNRAAAASICRPRAAAASTRAWAGTVFGWAVNGAEGERNALTGAGLDDTAVHALSLGDAAEPALEILQARNPARRQVRIEQERVPDQGCVGPVERSRCRRVKAM